MRFLFFIFALAFVFPYQAEAETVVRTGESVAVSAEQVVEGDFYGLGGTVAVSGEVAEDLLLIGGEVTVNGQVGADMAVIGGTVDIHGVVSDDLRVVGGTVVIAGTVTGNLVVFASDLKVLSTATIGGDLLFFGGEADISGSVGHDILGTSEQLRVDSVVGGSLDIKTGNLVLGERAEIGEAVLYNSSRELTRSQNALIKGEVVRSDVVVKPENNLRNATIAFLINLFAALVLYLLLKRFTLKVMDSAYVKPLRTCLIGFGVIFLAPISATILLASTLGSILGLLIITIYFVLIFITLSLIGAVTGFYVMRYINREKQVTVVTVVAGVLIVHAFIYLPIIGLFLFIMVFLLTLGTVFELTLKMFRNT